MARLDRQAGDSTIPQCQRDDQVASRAGNLHCDETAISNVERGNPGSSAPNAEAEHLIGDDAILKDDRRATGLRPRLEHYVLEPVHGAERLPNAT